MTTLTKPRGVASADSRKSLNAADTLGDCCEQRTVCRFVLVHNGYGASVTMVKLHPQGLELRVAEEDLKEPLLEYAICCVSFSIGHTFCAFMGHLIDVRRLPAGEIRVLVTVPKQLTATNLRQSFRVPLIKNSGLETTVQIAEGRRFPVTARNIAEAGIEIEFEATPRPELKSGMELDVELKFRGDIVHKKAQIRSIRGSKLGLSFTVEIDETGRQQDARLNGFVLSLQQLWLKSRIK